MATKKRILTHFCLGVGYIRHVISLLRQLFQWLLMPADCTKTSHKSNCINDINFLVSNTGV